MWEICVVDTACLQIIRFKSTTKLKKILGSALSVMAMVVGNGFSNQIQIDSVFHFDLMSIRKT